jgi:peptide maturation system protein (TIGR04066 family)
MTGKRRLVVSPVDIDSTPIVRYRDMMREYSFQGAVAPSGWGYGNKDICEIDGGVETGIHITDDFEKQLDECDTLLFSSSYHTISLPDYVILQIIAAAKRGKEILVSLPIDEGNKAQLGNTVKNYQSRVAYINKNEDLGIMPDRIRYELNTISVPVVMVFGLGDHCNKFETQLSLRKYFLNLGYNVCQLGTKGYSSLFGFQPLPDFLFGDMHNTEEKIYLFNHYIHRLEKETRPDLFIIGVPGGIMPFDNIATNHFGLMAYIITSALKPDAVILNLYYNSFTDDYFRELNNYCKYKFGFDVTCFTIANTKYSLSLEDKVNYLSFLSLGGRYVMTNISEALKVKWNLYNAFAENGASLPEHIYNVLAGNVNMLRNA